MAVQETMRVMRGMVHPVWTRVVRSRVPGAVLVRVDAGLPACTSSMQAWGYFSRARLSRAARRLSWR